MNPLKNLKKRIILAFKARPIIIIGLVSDQVLRNYNIAKSLKQVGYTRGDKVVMLPLKDYLALKDAAKRKTKYRNWFFEVISLVALEIDSYNIDIIESKEEEKNL